MADSLVPISDEQAKLGREVVGAVRDGGGWVADTLGDPPEDLLGLLIGDKVKVKRTENFFRLKEKTKARLRDQGIDPGPVGSWHFRSSRQLSMKTATNYKICGRAY